MARNVHGCPAADRIRGGFVADARFPERGLGPFPIQAIRSPTVTQRRPLRPQIAGLQVSHAHDTGGSTPRASVLIPVGRQVKALQSRCLRAVGEHPAEAAMLWPACLDQAAVARARRILVRAGDPLVALTEQSRRLS
jgi:hypothetical protein